MFTTQTVNNSSNKKTAVNNKSGIFRAISLIFLSIFLAYLTTVRYLMYGSIKMNFFYIIYLILILVYYFILSKLIIPYYSKAINFLVAKFNKTRLKNVEEGTLVAWFIPSLLLGMSSIFLLVLFIYYINLEVSILNVEIDYINTARSINSIILPISVIVSLLLAFILQSLFLIKKENVNWLPSIISSLMSIVWYTFGIVIFLNIVRVFLGGL